MSTETRYIAAGPYHDIISGIQLIFSFSDGVVKLVGATGCGKSSLLLELQRSLALEDQEAVLLSPPPKNVQELHNLLTREFSLGADISFRKSLARYIASKPRDQQRLVLLIDDAEEMDEETMLDLVQFRSIRQNDQGLVSIVLSGTSELEDKLGSSALEELTKDIVLNYNQDPLNLEELTEFCRAAIDRLDLGIPMPNTSMLIALLDKSGGLPGPVLEQLPNIGNLTLEPAAAASPEQAAPIAPALATVSTSTISAPEAELLEDDFDDEDEERTFPFDMNQIRKGLFGGVAIAATVAAAWFAYPIVAPLVMDKLPGATSTTASNTNITTPTPAPAPAPAPTPAPAAEPELVVSVETTIPAEAEVIPEPAPVVEPEVEAPALVAEVSDPKPVEEEQIVEAQIEEPAPTVAQTQTQTTPAPVVALTPPAPAVVAPAPASTSVSLVPVFPNATLTEATPEALQEVVTKWLTAWQNQDLDQYFGAYHTDFAPLYQNTRAAWRNNRIRSITRPEAISIVLEDFTVNGSSIVGSHVSFSMEYQSGSYADRTQKELVIGHDIDGSLRILQEISRQVTKLTPSEIQSSDSRTVIASTTQAPTTPTLSQGSTYTAIGAPVQMGSVFTSATTPIAASPSMAEVEVAAINNFLGTWLEAWQHQNLDDYFAHYQAGFKTSTFANHADWQQDRISKINRPIAIQIQLQNLQVVRLEPQSGEVELEMEYHSTYYADRTMKSLTLQRAAQGEWLISSEKNIKVEPLPIARLIPARTITLRGGLNTVFERSL